MHTIEPFYGWENYYQAHLDEKSPFYGKEYNYKTYENLIYGYFVHPDWDFIGSETLYVRILFCDYKQNAAIIELFGEWNDTLHNDIMYLKRTVIDELLQANINKFVLITENILNFHGGDDDYYAEWFEEVEDGWIALLNPRNFVASELTKYHIDYYVNFGGSLNIINWRTFSPQNLIKEVERVIIRRLG